VSHTQELGDLCKRTLLQPQYNDIVLFCIELLNTIFKVVFVFVVLCISCWVLNLFN